MDKGSETGFIFGFQTGLRYVFKSTSGLHGANLNTAFYSEAYAPDIDADKFPAAQHVHSINNTVYAN